MGCPPLADLQAQAGRRAGVYFCSSPSLTTRRIAILLGATGSRWDSEDRGAGWLPHPQSRGIFRARGVNVTRAAHDRESGLHAHRDGASQPSLLPAFFARGRDDRLGRDRERVSFTAYDVYSIILTGFIWEGGACSCAATPMVAASLVPDVAVALAVTGLLGLVTLC